MIASRTSDEYKDKRNALYRSKHKDDVISAHGQVMRKYYERTTRESRACERAKRQAFNDIVSDVMKSRQIDRNHAIRIVKSLFEKDQ